MPDDETHRQARERLAEARADLEQRAGALVAGAEVPSGGISFGKRVGEGTSIAIERFTDVALHGQLLRELAAIDAAVTRLDDGTYGICEGCQRPIPIERIDYLPWAARCVACS